MRLFFFVTLQLISTIAFCQELPLYSQYMYDPFIVNPSYVGRSGYTEANLIYRYQWAGINNAPKTAAFNLQYVTSPRIALGLSVINDEVILLSTTSALGTFGYRVPIKKNNIISFGLSAGVISNRIHLDELPPEDLSDPVFQNAGNTLKLDGQFGINYTANKFTIGFALLRLFDNNAFTYQDQTKIKFGQLQNKIITAAYRFNLGNNFEFSPYLSYRFNANNNFYEATGMFIYKNTISLGGFYRENYGPGFILRLKLNPKIDFGYAYEPATSQSSNNLGGSHEVQFKMKMGRQVEELLTRRDKLTIDSSSTTSPVAQNNQKPEVKSDSVKSVPPTKIKTQETPPSPSVVEPTAVAVVVAEQEEKMNAPKEMYDLVIGTFSSSSNAVSFVRKAKAKGLICEMKFVKETGYYYVLAVDYKTEDPKLDQLFSIRDKIPYKDAWFKKSISFK